MNRLWVVRITDGDAVAGFEVWAVTQAEALRKTRDWCRKYTKGDWVTVYADDVDLGGWAYASDGGER